MTSMTNNKTKVLQLRFTPDQFDVLDKAYKYYISNNTEESISKSAFLRNQLMIRTLCLLDVIVLPESKVEAV